MPTRYCSVDEYVCLEARGRDVQSFLHAQLSQSLDALRDDRAPLAAWLDARGRVRTLVRVVHTGERWLLVAPREGAADVVAQLEKYVLRSAVTLDIAQDLAIGAVLDVEPEWLAAHSLPADAAPSARVTRDAVEWLRVGRGYWQAIAPPAALEAVAAGTPRASAAAAALAEIRLGLALVAPPQAQRFVAQMLNLDELGALAFDKGCYPGQEIVARVRHRGEVKRRLRRYAVATSTPPPAGSEVRTADGAVVGEVVRSAPAETGSELLAVVELDAARSALTCAGTPLSARPLPGEAGADAS
jgi:tRNA-modifying protein YgfZ